MKLIEDWRKAWSFFSVQLAAALVLFDAAYEYLPAAKAYMPEGWVKWMAIAIILARLIRQREAKP